MTYLYFLTRRKNKIITLFASHNDDQFNKMIETGMPTKHQEAAMSDLLLSIDKMDIAAAAEVDKIMILATLMAKQEIINARPNTQRAMHVLFMVKQCKSSLFSQKKIATSILTFNGPDKIAEKAAAASFEERFKIWE